MVNLKPNQKDRVYLSYCIIELSIPDFTKSGLSNIKITGLVNWPHSIQANSCDVYRGKPNFMEVYFPTAVELLLWKYQALLDWRVQTREINIKLYFCTIQ